MTVYNDRICIEIQSEKPEASSPVSLSSTPRRAVAPARRKISGTRQLVR